ncbi:MAG TPA: DegT/DnrJ/EryC1/StrS family aminotransferase [Gammaproteobacteria bacterium]|nr:DegT/DnrJ/EryC1/StrS family aminotransferase [Gammaproteobacteria bacterium]
MIPMVDLRIQYRQIKAEIEQDLHQVLESAHFILGPNVHAFEEEAASYLGARYAIGCASGTDALQLALAAAGIGEGDEVITTPFTFIATAEAICYLGAKPVFVDIDPHTFNLDPGLVETAITERTRAILPVHLFGQPADMGPLLELARRHHLRVIEDCAQSFGASIGGRFTGTFGDAGCFSFFPSKNLGCFGDGGMITTNSEELAARLKMLRNHGSRERYHHSIIGYNSRLDEIQAVILRAKLKRITAYNEGRRAAAHTYSRRLAELPGITPPHEDGRGIHVYHQYTLLTNRRGGIMQALSDAGISSAIYYPIPLHRQEVFAQRYRNLSLPVSESVAERCLSLPIYPELESEQIHTIVDVIKAHVTA